MALISRHTTRPPRRRAAALLAIALSATALSAAACGGQAQQPSPAAAPATADKDTVTLSRAGAADAGVQVSAVQTVDRMDGVDAPGTVGLDERRTARLGALVEGVVSRIDVQPGDRVRAGQALARLHSHAVHDAWAAYFKALAARRSAERAVAFAETAEQRALRLFEDKAFSRQEAERAAADRVHAEQVLAAARAEVVRSEEELQHYGMTPREDAPPAASEYIRVAAPFDGVVIERLASEGAAVVPGTPLMVVSDLATVWVEAEIDERHVARLARGHAAEISVAAYPDERFSGRIDAIGDVINPATRRVAVRVTVPNADGRLKPQMFATVRLGAARPHRALVVPSAAVQQVDGAAIVFVAAEEGRYLRREVSLGGEVDGQVEITSGLREGERIVTAGAFLMKSALAGPDEEP